ncbi:MAG: hypothetical protein QM784_22625 [Polyangiaceae bacterium]
MRLHKGLGMLMVWLVAITSTGCSSNDDDAGTCTQGELGCTCLTTGTCNGALACVNNQCVQNTSGVGGSTAITTVPGNGGSTTAGVGGTTAAGTSSATCSSTLTDPNNCGKCGHVCKSGTCSAGTCGAALAPCFSTLDGYTTCQQSCAAIGQTCVASGCSNRTAIGWDEMDTCSRGITSGSTFSGACTDVVPVATMGFVRCCCTDN